MENQLLCKNFLVRDGVNSKKDNSRIENKDNHVSKVEPPLKNDWLSRLLDLAKKFHKHVRGVADTNNNNIGTEHEGRDSMQKQKRIITHGEFLKTHTRMLDEETKEDILDAINALERLEALKKDSKSRKTNQR